MILFIFYHTMAITGIFEVKLCVNVHILSLSVYPKGKFVSFSHPIFLASTAIRLTGFFFHLLRKDKNNPDHFLADQKQLKVYGK